MDTFGLWACQLRPTLFTNTDGGPRASETLWKQYLSLTAENYTWINKYTCKTKTVKFLTNVLLFQAILYITLATIKNVSLENITLTEHK